MTAPQKKKARKYPCFYFLSQSPRLAFDTIARRIYAQLGLRPTDRKRRDWKALVFAKTERGGHSKQTKAQSAKCKAQVRQHYLFCVDASLWRVNSPRSAITLVSLATSLRKSHKQEYLANIRAFLFFCRSHRVLNLCANLFTHNNALHCSDGPSVCAIDLICDFIEIRY